MGDFDFLRVFISLSSLPNVPAVVGHHAAEDGIPPLGFHQAVDLGICIDRQHHPNGEPARPAQGGEDVQMPGDRGLAKDAVGQAADSQKAIQRAAQRPYPEQDGLGPENNRRRDGTYEYYISEPVVENDAKGLAPFLMCYTELLLSNEEELQNEHV